MATGADRGFLDEERAQSTYKHAIIGQYLGRFIAITGSRSPRVALVDGYAGSGRHGSGLGSSGLMLEAAESAQARTRTRVVLVESDRKRFAALDTLTTEFRSRGIDATASRALIELELPQILDDTSDDALFLFLDPCGALLGFDALVKEIRQRRPNSWPPTDIVLNLSAGLSRRAAGQLLKHTPDAYGVARLDEVVGGQWWHDIARRQGPQDTDGTYAVVVEMLAAEYGKRIASALNMEVLVVPIREKEHLQPIYHLVFLTRSTLGIAQFADAVARARPAWLEATYGGELDLFEALGEESLGKQAARARTKSDNDASRAAIEKNIVGLAAERGAFCPLDHITAIYGAQIDIANQTQVERALNSLVTRGVLTLATASKYPMKRTYRVVGRV